MVCMRVELLLLVRQFSWGPEPRCASWVTLHTGVYLWLIRPRGEARGTTITALLVGRHIVICILKI